MKQRIAMISYHTCPLASEEGKESGGMNVYTLELGRALVGLGYTVDIFTRSQGADNEAIVNVSPSLRVIHLVAGGEKPISKKELAPYIPDFVNAFIDFCSKEHVTYDALDAHYYLSGLIAVQIQSRLKPKIPIIMSFHTLALMKNLVARNDAEKEDPKRIEAEKLLITQVDRIVAPSESEKSYLEFFYGAKKEKIAVIPPGVDMNLFRPIDMNTAKDYIHVSHEQKLILFAGRIEPLKGIDLLLYALKIVTQRNPNIPVYLCIVGGDISQVPEAWSETLKSLNTIRTLLHLTANVNFVGQQPQHTLPYYYNAANVVVMPSHYESFGMAALEAMACGTPVITTNATGVSSLIDEKHGSLITSVNNPLLLASQIEYLLLDPKNREEIGKSIRLRIKDLTWASTAKQISSLYTILMKEENI